MHVFFINARYAPERIAGPAFTTQYLAEQLVSEGDQATIFCRTERPGVILESYAGVTIVRAGLDIVTRRLAQVIVDALNSFKPDVIHVLFPRDLPIGLLSSIAAQPRVPVVQTLLSFFLLCPRGSMTRNGRICTTQCADCLAATVGERDYAKRVAGVVGISRFMLELHQRCGLFHSTPVRQVIYDTYQPPLPGGKALGGDGALRLGYLGRLVPEKGIELLLKTLTTELDGRDWTLLVAGQGDAVFERMLRHRYPDPRIRFLGFMEPSTLLSQIDVLVVPSIWHEPFPRVTFEAYAHAVPVIGSRRGGIPEGIDHGETGYVFDPGAAGDLERTLRTVLDNPQRLHAMKLNALEKWRREFTPSEIMRQYRNVYSAVSLSR